MENYNFDKAGKRLPYRVPDNFFDDVERSIIGRARACRDKGNILRMMGCIGALAAALALLVVAFNPGVFGNSSDFTDVDVAFDQLSDADRSYMLDVYQDDIFINQY